MPAFYIVLQEKISGVDAIGLEGRARSKYSDKLEVLARQAGVRSLDSFFSTDREEVLGLLGEEEIAARRRRFRRSNGSRQKTDWRPSRHC